MKKCLPMLFLLLAGCATDKSSGKVEPSILVDGIVEPRARIAARSVAQAVQAPAWPKLKAVWDQHPDSNQVFFRFYHGTNLNRATWVEIGTTTNNWFIFQSEQMGFVGVKASWIAYPEITSDWNK